MAYIQYPREFDHAKHWKRKGDVSSGSPQLKSHSQSIGDGNSKT
jgi:hypothetical protein